MFLSGQAPNVDRSFVRGSLGNKQACWKFTAQPLSPGAHQGQLGAQAPQGGVPGAQRGGTPSCDVRILTAPSVPAAGDGGRGHHRRVPAADGGVRGGQLPLRCSL